jgi:hypothetical protein
MEKMRPASKTRRNELRAMVSDILSKDIPPDVVGFYLRQKTKLTLIERDWALSIARVRHSKESREPRHFDPKPKLVRPAGIPIRVVGPGQWVELFEFPLVRAQVYKPSNDCSAYVIVGGSHTIWAPSTEVRVIAEPTRSAESLEEREPLPPVGKRKTLLGFPMTTICRWMGSQEWTCEEALAVFESCGMTPAASTVSIQLKAGQSDQDVPTLTREQERELFKILEEISNRITE